MLTGLFSDDTTKIIGFVDGKPEFVVRPGHL
jgi:hypothetical protein